MSEKGPDEMVDVISNVVIKPSTMEDWCTGCCAISTCRMNVSNCVDGFYSEKVGSVGGPRVSLVTKQVSRRPKNRDGRGAGEYSPSPMELRMGPDEWVG